MSMERTLIFGSLFALAVWMPVRSEAQAFRNLGFESAQVSNPTLMDYDFPYFYWTLPTATATPYWKSYIHVYDMDSSEPFSLGNESSWVVYNSVALDYPTVGLYDSAAATPGPVGGGYQWAPATPIAGGRSVYLHAEWWFGEHQDAAIAQTGVIPAEAKSIQFLTSPDYIFDYQAGLPRGDMWELYLGLNGVRTTYYKLEEQPNYIRWGADVSGLAGTLTELSFTLSTGITGLSTTAPTCGIIVGIDSISFSPSIVPEPSSVGLLAVGIGALMMPLRRR